MSATATSASNIASGSIESLFVRQDMQPMKLGQTCQEVHRFRGKVERTRPDQFSLYA
jgi:hypothetical protein